MASIITFFKAHVRLTIVVIIYVLIACTAWWRYVDILTFVRPGLVPEGAFSVHAMRLYAHLAGSEAMYVRYAKVLETHTIGRAHRAAHVIGQVLYEREGVGAIAICGQYFTAGCLHQVMGLALAEYGEDAIEELIFACHETTGSSQGMCAHSLGHGLVYITEYDPKKLIENLYKCDAMHQPPVDHLQSCYAGVFMEYNTHLMEYQLPEPRPYTPAEEVAFCTAFADPLHQRMCIFWLVSLIHIEKYAFAYSPTVFRELGDFCESVPTDELQRECYMSIGRTISINGLLEPEQAFAYCGAAAENSKNMRACTNWASRAYHEANNDRAANILCEKLPKEEVNACKQYAFAFVETI